MDDAVTHGLTINRPAWFKHEGFLFYLNGARTLTWHNGGMQGNEWSDVVVLVDPGCSGDGPDADAIPGPIWREIVALCREHLGSNLQTPHYLVRITNLDDDDDAGSDSDRPSYWGEVNDFPVEDWQNEVANDDTRESYWQWVANQRSQAAEDCDDE